MHTYHSSYQIDGIIAQTIQRQYTISQLYRHLRPAVKRLPLSIFHGESTVKLPLIQMEYWSAAQKKGKPKNAVCCPFWYFPEGKRENQKNVENDQN